MKKLVLNAFSLVIIGLGAMMLNAAPASAGSCDGPAGSQGCTCTSGDGKFKCTGDSCTSSATGCTFTDHQLVP